MRGPVAIFRSQKGSASEFGKQCFKVGEVLVFTRVTLRIKQLHAGYDTFSAPPQQLVAELCSLATCS